MLVVKKSNTERHGVKRVGNGFTEETNKIVLESLIFDRI